MCNTEIIQQIIIFMAEQSSRETEPNPAHTERVKSSTEGGGGIKQRQTEQNPAERENVIHKRETE